MTLFRLASGLDALDACKVRVGPSKFEALKATGAVPGNEDFPPFVDGRLRRIIKKATAATPAARYPSALDMRRALERLDYPGYWDADASGRLFGVRGPYRFTFEVNGSAGVTGSPPRFNVKVWKEDTRSGRRQQVSKFAANRVPEREVSKLQLAVMQAVLRGEL
jgi:hypothetical protein